MTLDFLDAELEDENKEEVRRRQGGGRREEVAAQEQGVHTFGPCRSVAA